MRVNVFVDGFHCISRKYSILLGLLIYTSLAVLAGCKNTEEAGKTQTQSPEEQEEKSSGTIRVNAKASTRPFYSVPQVENSLVIGIDADMSSGSARSGEAIRRGLELAIEEINRDGGLLGRPVELIVRDHRGNPDRGLDNLAAFTEVRDLIGVFGGIHTPVAIRELEFIHSNDLLYFCPWAAGTPVVKNGFSPNHVFRVSVRDEYAGGFLVRSALQRGGKKIGLMLERTAWGRSNEKAMKEALADQGLERVGEEWFNWGEKNLSLLTQRLAAKDCDTILLVCNSLEGVAAVKAVAGLPDSQRPRVVSHWGISGGRFFELAQDYLDGVDLSFLQSFSFVQPRYPERVQALTEAYLAKYEDCQSPRGIFAPVGTAHSYELMRMVALAIHNSQSIETTKLRESLEALENYHGIIRDYDRPFPFNHHDALDASDFFLARFDSEGVIVPLEN